jgi:dihydroxyacetone kinase-like protein
MVKKILTDMPVAAGEEIVVLVNGCGATPLMELYILYNEASKLLQAGGIKIHRSYVGEYMTSLEMAGAALSVLRLDAELKSLIDAKADTPGFKQF